jgi:lipopolysaccharide transport system ATP-binding protein
MWALDDVSFQITQGEVVGVIGRNGAGKSTLLKILSRITLPTRGAGEVNGRIGSLLEVGSGFHTELSGRENVYFSGAVLGMTKSEITRKFDEIVEFADVSSFIDTPVKFYSSGMHLRLAFSVAAHLDSEIMLIDEALAVGDASFRHKCLSKMNSHHKDGRTVVLVSHDMTAVARLCPRTLVLNEGRLLYDGPSAEVISAYLRDCLGLAAKRDWCEETNRPGDDVARLHSVRVCNGEGTSIGYVDIRRPIGVQMEFEILKSGHVVVPNYRFFNESGVCLFVSAERDTPWQHQCRPVGRHLSTAWIPGNFLAEGTLIIDAALTTPDPLVVHVFERDVLAFQVIDSLNGGSARGEFGGTLPGVVRPILQWDAEVFSRRQLV